MRWILLALLISSQAVFAVNLIKGEGKFTAINGDGHEFIKKQLIFEGIKDIISIELENLKLNKEAFWQKYDDALNEKLAEIEKNYKELKKFDEEVSEKRKQRILEIIRKKQLNFRRTYLGLNNLLKKFSIRKISRSQKNPNYRYIKLEGEINSAKLTKTYYNLVRGKKTSEYGSLYIRPKFNLNGISYNELGVDNEKEIIDEVTKNWLEWLIKNKPVNIANVENLTGDKELNYEKLIKMDSTNSSELIPEYFVNSLVLEIELNIEKEKFNEKIKEYTFVYSGNAFLRDIQTKLTVGTYKFAKNEKSYILSGKMNLANIVANHVYQMAKSSFPRVQRHIKNMSPVSEVKEISLNEFESINQVHSFLSLAESRGVKFSLKTKLESFGQNRAKALIYYDGDSKELTELLIQLQSAKKDLSFEVIESDKQLGIKFNKVVENI